MSEATFVPLIDLTKPGQRYATPSPGQADRVFYESLLRENPKSPMALVWCIEHGVLADEEASRLMSAYQAAKKGVAFEVEPSASESKPARAPKSRKNVIMDAPVDAGLSVGGVETVGAMTF